MAQLDKIADNIVKKADTKEDVTMSSFWAEGGCLAQAGVRLIGIGLEELGVEEFIEGKFFDGELYIDTDKKNYKALNFKNLGVLAMIPALVAKVARDTVRKAKQMGISGDMKGDKMQTGGLLVVSPKGEKVLYEFKQENPADHAENAAILKFSCCLQSLFLLLCLVSRLFFLLLDLFEAVELLSLQFIKLRDDVGKGTFIARNDD
ncbi:prostaglandin F synthase [Penaeus vannamei]|uniref:Prostaglandin F synthase n=1 Tax=Penaeus vannamei TaxID=6689 RepID=A0A3R7M6X2_PENVA|nr:prostaglandin F synthase [Penaeus vannamei]